MPETLSDRRLRTKEAILDAALNEFVLEGYGGATLAGVARRAAVSTATLHKYFATKKELFGGVMARFWENGETLSESRTESPEAGLIEIGQAYAKLLLGAQTAPLFRVIIAETIRHPELGQELYERGKKPYLDRLEAYVRRHASEGTLDVDDAGLAVRQFLGMINDIVFWPRLLVSDLQISSTEADHVIRAAAKTFMARFKGR